MVFDVLQVYWGHALLPCHLGETHLHVPLQVLVGFLALHLTLPRVVVEYLAHLAEDVFHGPRVLLGQLQPVHCQPVAVFHRVGGREGEVPNQHFINPLNQPGAFGPIVVVV